MLLGDNRVVENPSEKQMLEERDVLLLMVQQDARSTGLSFNKKYTVAPRNYIFIAPYSNDHAENQLRHPCTCALIQHNVARRIRQKQMYASASAARTTAAFQPPQGRAPRNRRPPRQKCIPPSQAAMLPEGVLAVSPSLTTTRPRVQYKTTADNTTGEIVHALRHSKEGPCLYSTFSPILHYLQQPFLVQL